MLIVVTALITILGVFLAGIFFFWLHSLPERLVHRSSKLHFDLVAVLALISLFTHIHAFWIAALLLALIELPKASQLGVLKPFERIASALDRLHATTTDRREAGNAGASSPKDGPQANASESDSRKGDLGGQVTAMPAVSGDPVRSGG